MRRCPACKVNLANCNRHICVLTHGKCKARNCKRIAIRRPFHDCDEHMVCLAKGCDKFIFTKWFLWWYCDAHKCKWDDACSKKFDISEPVCIEGGNPNYCSKHVVWVRGYRKLCKTCGRVQPWKMTAYLCLRRTFCKDICKMIMQYLPQTGVCGDECNIKPI